MKRSSLGAGLLVLASSMMLLVGTASAHGSATPDQETPGTCTIKSLPSFVAQGEYATTATVADVIEIGCNPMLYGTGSKVKVTASQLSSACKHNVTWYVPNPYRVVPESETSGVTLTLDPDGNATVALIAGPFCSASESLITVHELEEPFESFTTSFEVLPPNNTAEGVFAMPSSQIEDAESSAVATIIETEFPNASEKKLRVGSEELYARCRTTPHAHWITEAKRENSNTGEVTGLELDNNGNAFVLAIGDSSCFPGASLIEADLESKPFATLTTNFTILSPKPRA